MPEAGPAPQEHPTPGLAELRTLIGRPRLDLPAVLAVLNAFAAEQHLGDPAQPRAPRESRAPSNPPQQPECNWTRFIRSPRGWRAEQQLAEAVKSLPKTITIYYHEPGGARHDFEATVTEDAVQDAELRFLKAFDRHPHYFLAPDGKLLVDGPAVRDGDDRIVAWSVRGALVHILRHAIVDNYRQRRKDGLEWAASWDSVIAEDRRPELRDGRDPYVAADERLDARTSFEFAVEGAAYQTEHVRKGIVALAWFHFFEPPMPKGAGTRTEHGQSLRARATQARTLLSAALGLVPASLGKYRERARAALREALEDSGPAAASA